MRPLPAASGVIHPVSPQTSKRGGYGRAGLCGTLISPPTTGKTVGHFEYSKSAQKRKRRARKVIKPFVLSSEHKQSSILTRRPKSFSSECW